MGVPGRDALLEPVCALQVMTRTTSAPMRPSQKNTA